MALPLNTAILSSPQNWIRIWLMVFIGAIAFDVLARNIRIKMEGE
jgi:hypothetical protein